MKLPPRYVTLPTREHFIGEIMDRGTIKSGEIVKLGNNSNGDKKWGTNQTGSLHQGMNGRAPFRNVGRARFAVF